MADNNPVKVSIIDPIQLNVNMPNIKGDAGKDGASAYLTAVKNGFVGTEREWLESLKANIDVTQAYETLMRNNVYCASKDVVGVVNGFLSGLGDLAKKQAREFEYDVPVPNQLYISMRGEPHYWVGIQNAPANERVEFSQDGTILFQLKTPFGSDSITFEYYNMLKEKVSESTIQGSVGVKTSISDYEFARNDGSTEYYFPEVTSVGEQAFHQYTLKIKLPKATTIASNAFSMCRELEELELPSYILSQNNKFDNVFGNSLQTMVINDSSAMDVLSEYSDETVKAIIYNQDKTKKFDKATKTWVSAQ